MCICVSRRRETLRRFFVALSREMRDNIGDYFILSHAKI